MWFIRVKRVFLILVVVVAVILVARRAKAQGVGEQGWIGEIGKNILGAFTKNEQPKPEFINQQVDLVKKKLDQLLEQLKKMPAEEAQAVKKKVIGDFCQKLLEEK